MDDSYPFDVLGSDPWQVDFRPAICAIVGHVKRGVRAGVISARFHNTIAAVIVQLCCRLRQAVHLNQVCLSGGTFQNIYLLTERSLVCVDAGSKSFCTRRFRPMTVASLTRTPVRAHQKCDFEAS